VNARVPRLLCGRIETVGLRYRPANYRTHAIATVYVVSVAVAHYLAFWLRFDGAIPAAETAVYLRTLLPLLAIYGVAFVGLGRYRGRWRDTSIWEVRDLFAVAAVSAALCYVFVTFWMRVTNYPRSVFIVGAILSVCLFGGLRLARRLTDEGRLAKDHHRVLIVGAGNAGELIARDLRKKGHQPIGFIDDDLAKKGNAIQGVKVLGSREDLARIVTIQGPDEVLIAIPSADSATIRKYINALERFKVPITTLPPLREIVDGKVNISQVRKVEVEDLLPRMPVHLDPERARQLVEGRRVMVTGAGGSIGSELCRQVARLDPDRLIVYERYENNLYAVLNTLPQSFRIKATLGDVTDRRRLDAVVREHRPDIIFHAAAHKHVPLMELNPCEAVKNNVIGTRMVAEAAMRFPIDRFILISTDKAVNPTSLMGATKRAAELVVQAMAMRPGARVAIVRFGNVLGSNGSVIPRWLDQIAAGGPVTVTHPDVKRYFMLIPEAVELILQAAAVTRGGDIFALEMGEQINLLKMARELIRLAGFIPEEEIPIKIVGLRPGEKLSEELVSTEEELDGAPVEKILRLKANPPANPDDLLLQISTLGTLAQRGQTGAVIDLLRRLVPTFAPAPQLTAESDRPAARRVPRALAKPRATASRDAGAAGIHVVDGHTSLHALGASALDPPVPHVPSANGNGKGIEPVGFPNTTIGAAEVRDHDRSLLASGGAVARARRAVTHRSRRYERID
jgi:FlaA1/EpsC-like NDP-sugar epimerase